jgi:GNAT superfamily N-acetyltransferase
MADAAGEASGLRVDPVGEADRAWIREVTIAEWGAEIVVAHDEVFRPDRLDGLVARFGSERVGLATFEIRGEECELVTLNALRSRRGVGSALLEAVRSAARDAGCRRLRLVTTNDNVDALRFYQRRGFSLVAVHRGAVERSRRIKPEIPLQGDHGIPIRDEIELEQDLSGSEPL